MKRIQSACIEKILLFKPDEKLERARALNAIREEAAAYKAYLNDRHIAHQILDEKALSDSSICLRIKINT